MERWRNGIGLTIVVLLTIGPLAILQAVNELHYRRWRQIELETVASRSAGTAAAELNGVVESVKTVLLGVVDYPPVRSRQVQTCSDYLVSLIRHSPLLAFLAATDLDGRIICSSMPATTSWIGELHFANAIKVNSFGEYATGLLVPTPTLPVAMPLLNEDGNAIGAVLAAVDLLKLSDHLRLKGFDGKASVLFVADWNGTIMIRIPDQRRWIGTQIGAPYLKHLRAPGPSVEHIMGLDGTPRVLGYEPLDVPPVGLYIAVALDRDMALASIDGAVQRRPELMALAVAASISVGLLAGWMLLRRLLRLR